MQDKTKLKDKILKIFLFKALDGVHFRFDFSFSSNPKSKDLDCKTNFDLISPKGNSLEYDSET